MDQEIRVAIAGNPNSGKTSVWNGLTGARAHVGNYPGVTVEKREATLNYPRAGAAVPAAAKGRKRKLRLVDLPGTYSLSAASPEEVVARDFIVEEHPEVVVQILDATNLERNLYLSTQLKELGCRVVYALNMSDLAGARGLIFDVPLLAQRLGGPVIPTVGTRGGGFDALLDAIVEVADRPGDPHERPFAPSWGEHVGAAIDGVEKLLPAEAPELTKLYPARWLAARLVEGESDLLERVKSPVLKKALDEADHRIAHDEDRQPMIVMAEARYGWISGVCAGAVQSVAARRDRSAAIDKVLCNRVLGLPIFLGLMYLMFQLVFTLGGPPMEWIENFFGWLGETVAGWWPKAAESDLRDLLVDGIIGGVGGVVVFLPNIILLFLAISFLEDTGYMARAAFLMDRLMRQVGLQGKSFIPMLLGFGCTVPAIMATRTLENRRDRLTTIMVLPLMSCGARLPIYMLLVPAFFSGKWQASMVWIMYVIGIVVALVAARVLRATLFKGESVPFVMELPPYRAPSPRNVVLHMWDRAWSYLRKAGTIILAVSVLLWIMATYPKKPEEKFAKNYGELAVENTNEFVAAAARLGDNRLPPGGAEAMRSFAMTEVESDMIAENFRESEPGFGEGTARVGERRGKIGADPAIGALMEKVFAEIGKRRDEEAELAEAAEGEDEESEAYKEALAARDAVRAARAKEEPVVAEIAALYLDEVRAAYTEKRNELKHGQLSEELAYSVTGRVGGALEPLLKPLGFDWRIGTAMIGAFAAKEVFVSQMGIVFNVGDEADEESETLRETLRKNYTPLQAFAMMLFSLLSMPCVATIAVTRREAGGWGWALGMLVGLTVLAYVFTFFAYQIGTAMGWGTGTL